MNKPFGLINPGIRARLLGTYLLIIAGILLGMNWLVLRTLEANYLHDREVKAITDANVIALAGREVIKQHDRNTYYWVRNFGEQIQARVLVLDKSGRVTIDSYGENWLEGRVLAHDEIVSALKGAGKTGVHTLQSDEKVLYAAVPVGEDKAVAGAVMLVVSLADIYTALGEIQSLMLAISGVGGLLAVIAGLFLAAYFTRPLQNLTAAVQMMAGGQLHQRVKVTSHDEIGRLAGAFNEMAAKLEGAEQTRRQFLADASHELKTPLSSVKVMAQSLLDAKEPDINVYRDFLQDINAEVDRLNRLVIAIFQLTKLEDGDYPVEFCEQEITSLLTHIQGLMSGKARQKGVDLEIYPTAQPPRSAVNASASLRWPVNQDLLACILVNLIDNALRYTPSGGQVKVTAAREGEELVIKVTDTGKGMAAEELTHIFERFYRIDRARTRGTGGTGLGLAVVHQAVHRHGGTITVQSQPGQGTTFEIRLPFNSD